MQLSGKTILVSGATKGIGAAIAKRFHAEGARVIGTGRAANCDPVAYIHTYLPVDFSRADEVIEFSGKIAEIGIDVLVNNAGINKISPFEEIQSEDFASIIQVNLTAPMLLCRAVIPHMKKNGWGRIVNLSSIFGKISREFRAPYSASKFGLDGLTIALSAELSEFGILANCVAPGFTETDLTKKILGATGMAKLAEDIPMKRLAEPFEIAELVYWLGSPLNTYLTGQNIAIDGGFSRV